MMEAIMHFPRSTTTLTTLAAAGLILAGCTSEQPRFDPDDPACEHAYVKSVPGYTINLCNAANEEQAIVEADVDSDVPFELTDLRGNPVTHDDQGNPVMVGDIVEVVCFDDETSSVGILVPNISEDSFAFVKHHFFWTTGQVDGENFHPVVLMKSNAITDGVVVMEQLIEERDYDAEFTLAAACTNRLVVVPSSTAVALEAIANE